MKSAIVIVALAGVAAAQPADLGQAKDRFDRGLALFDRGEFTGALAEFEAAYNLSHRWELLFNVAVTQKRLYRYDASVQTFARYLRDGGDQVPADRRAQVEVEQAETVKLTGQVTIAVDGAPAEIEIDGFAGWHTPIDHAVLVRGGSHTVTATRAGFSPASKKFDIVSGDAIDVHLVLAPIPTVVIPPGHVTIETTPPGAQVRDGQHPLGVAPWAGDLDRGTHTILATLPGFRDASSVIHLDPDEHLNVALRLEEIPPPLYRRWYVLAGVGAAVVGIVVAGYVLTRSSPDVVIAYP